MIGVMGTVTADGLVGHAIWVPNARNGGGTYDPDGYGYPWRVVAHTIEGSASPGMIAGHPYPPHLWYDPATRVLYQTVPLGRSAFALYQAGDAPHYTNKARALQVEIAGHAADTAVWPTEWCDNIAEDVIVPFCEWAAMQGGQIDLLGFIPDPGPIPGSATADAPQRLTPDQWAALRSMCGHRHVPMGDDHWDPGGLDLRRIARHAAIIIGGLLPPPPVNPPTEDDDDMRFQAFRIPNGAVYIEDVQTGRRRLLSDLAPTDRTYTSDELLAGLAELVNAGLVRGGPQGYAELGWVSNFMLEVLDDVPTEDRARA